MTQQSGNSYFKQSLDQIPFQTATEISSSVIERMKKLIRSSEIEIQKVFEQYDKGKTGLISNLEFRNGLRQLNLGLSKNEVDTVLNIC